MSRVREMCLMNKLSAISRDRSRQGTALKDYEVQRRCFIDSKFSIMENKMKDRILVVI